MEALTGISAEEATAMEAAAQPEVTPATWDSYLGGIEESLRQDHPEWSTDAPAATVQPAANQPEMAQQARMAADAARGEAGL
jgi:hypothetical protein